MKRLLLFIVGLTALAPISHGALYEAAKEGTMTNLYYSVSDTVTSAESDLTITNLTQTLRSYAPPRSGYITEDLVRNIINETDSTKGIAIILAEVRRKEEFEATREAQGASLDLNHEDQGKVLQAIRESEMRLKENARIDETTLEPEQQPTQKTSLRSWDDLIASGAIVTVFTQRDIAQGRIFFDNLYAQERELAELEIELTAEQKYSTMFENGTLDDSFYDLVVDINEIDKLWFGSQAAEFKGEWIQPLGLPQLFEDPRIQDDRAGGRPSPGTIRLDGSTGNVYVPRTNKVITTPYQETLNAQKQNTIQPDYYDTPVEERGFMPFVAKHNSSPPNPSVNERFCMSDMLCVQVDINVLTYPLFGSADTSIRQQLEELLGEISEMSQKNLATKTAGKNVFEIGLTPGADLTKMLNMDIVVANKPMNLEKDEATPTERAKTLEDIIQNNLSDCFNTENALANQGVDGSNNRAEFKNEKLVAAEEQKQQECFDRLNFQALREVQALRNEGHEQSMTQLSTMRNLLENLVNELAAVAKQTTLIEEKPAK